MGHGRHSRRVCLPYAGAERSSRSRPIRRGGRNGNSAVGCELPNRSVNGRINGVADVTRASRGVREKSADLQTQVGCLIGDNECATDVFAIGVSAGHVTRQNERVGAVHDNGVCAGLNLQTSLRDVFRRQQCRDADECQ